MNAVKREWALIVGCRHRPSKDHRCSLREVSFVVRFVLLIIAADLLVPIIASSHPRTKDHTSSLSSSSLLHGCCAFAQFSFVVCVWLALFVVGCCEGSFCVVVRQSDSQAWKLKAMSSFTEYYFKNRNWEIPGNLDDLVLFFLFSFYRRVDLRVCFLDFGMRDVTLPTTLTCGTAEKNRSGGCRQINRNDHPGS